MERLPRSYPLTALAAVVAVLAVFTACTSARRGPEPQVIERGVASWYGPKFDGRPTASGERFDMYAMTAAHRSLPFGTVLEVRNLDNGKTCRVRVNDRGPFVRGRIVDLSFAAARALDMVGPGTARVELAVVSRLEPGPVLASAPLPPVPPRDEEATAADAVYTVQVGAFREEARAETLRDLLAARYPSATVRSDGTLHRVQVGTFEDRDAAEILRRELQRLGWAALVVALR
jgi:rare lipoprotein A